MDSGGITWLGEYQARRDRDVGEKRDGLIVTGDVDMCGEGGDSWMTRMC